jgi:hypothetical protein
LSSERHAFCSSGVMPCQSRFVFKVAAEVTQRQRGVKLRKRFAAGA